MASSGEDLLEANWGGLLDEAAVHTQTLSQLTDEAVQACPSSDESSAHDAVPVCESSESEGPMPTQSWSLKPASPWWAYRLVHLTRQYSREEIRRPVNIISGCAGVSAESFVFKVGNRLAD